MGDTDDMAERSTSTADGDDPAVAAELSRAAREAVRQPPDPRIDRQLARMGLAGPDAGSTDADRGPSRPSRSVDADALREEVAASRAEATSAVASLEALRRRLDLVTTIVVIEGVVVAILAVLLLVR